MALAIRHTATEEEEIEKLKETFGLKTVSKVFTHLVLSCRGLLDELDLIKKALDKSVSQFNRLIGLWATAQVEVERKIRAFLGQGGAS